MNQPSAQAPAYVFQLATAYRFFDRFQAARTLKLETEINKINDFFDFLEASFQSCWHVKDWIRNDSSIDEATRDSIWQEVQRTEVLLIVADLANGTKHLVRDPKLERVGAGTDTIDVKRNPDGTSTLTMNIALRDGRRFTDFEVVDNAMKAWQSLLKRHGLIYFPDRP